MSRAVPEAFRDGGFRAAPVARVIDDVARACSFPRLFGALSALVAFALLAVSLAPSLASAQVPAPPPAEAGTIKPNVAAEAGATGSTVADLAPCPTAANLITSSTLTANGVSSGFQPHVKDGRLAVEGVAWNSPDGIVLANTHSHLVFDFGAPRELRALVLQGDNNDQYTIEGSLDGVLYQSVWIAPVADWGQGLRTRSFALPKPATARYLRVTPRGGDSYYSVSEVQAFCKLSKAFPPALILPPKKYGWDAIDNDGMVAIKGWLALVATLLLACAWFAPLREARLRSAIVQVVIAGAVVLIALASLALGYIALKTPATLPFATQRGSYPAWFYTAGIFMLCGLALIALFVRSGRAEGGAVRGGGPRLFDSVLAIVGILSMVAWWNFGHYHFDHYIHIWEHYHYIVGAKYGPELRYAHLYQCTGTADVQDGLTSKVKARKMRRIESDNELGTTAAILKDPNICLSHFTPARWQQFKTDIRFFRGRFSQDRWDESQQDHGYNGTPVWAIAARYLADRAKLTSWDTIVKLGLIDSGYLVAMWLAVLWAFGWRSTAVALVYWGCNFPARFYWNGGSFLRYDWILWLVVGICFLRKKRMFLGGAALTYGALLRIFPGFVVATIILKALHAMYRERRIFLSRSHMFFAGGCIAALLVLIPASSWATGGLDAWPEFAQNSKKHLSTALTNNMGLKTLMGYDFSTRARLMRNDKRADPFQDWKDAKQHFYKTRAPFYYALIILFMFMLARAADREEEEWAAACLGVGLIVIAAELTCYYYGFLLTYGLLWERRKLPGVLASALAAFTCFIYAQLDWNDEHFAAMSLATVVVVVAVTAQAAFGKRVAPSEASTAADNTQLPAAHDAFGPASASAPLAPLAPPSPLDPS